MRKTLVDFKHVSGPAFDSILLALIQIVTYATNIITTKLLSVELSLLEYGTYSTVNSIITIAASFTLFGLGDSINYYYNRKTEDSDGQMEKIEYVNTIFFIQLIIGVIVGLFLMFFSGLISSYYHNPLVKPLVLIVCLKPWISNATHLYQVLFVSSGKAKLIAIRNLIISILKVFLLFIAVMVFDSLSVVFGCLVALDIAQLIAFKYIFGKINFKINIFSFCKQKLPNVIKYTVPMGIYFVTTTLMREIDKLVIGGLGTVEELAVYANCAKTLPVNILITSFATVLVPYIMRNVSSKNYQLTVQILKKYLTIGYLSVWMFSSVLLLCATESIRFFYSSEYITGLPIFVIYVLEGMIQFAGVHLVIAANGDSKFLMRTSILLLLFNAVLSVVLYRIFSGFGVALFGPAIATLFISIVYVYIFYCQTSKILQVKIRDFLPLRSMIVYLCQLFAIGLFFYAVKYIMLLGNLPWMIILIGVGGGYCVLIFLCNIKQYKSLFGEINQLKNSKL